MVKKYWRFWKQLNLINHVQNDENELPEKIPAFLFAKKSFQITIFAVHNLSIINHQLSLS